MPNGEKTDTGSCMVVAEPIFTNSRLMGNFFKSTPVQNFSPTVEVFTQQLQTDSAMQLPPAASSSAAP
jgi:hypothetical protein